MRPPSQTRVRLALAFLFTVALVAIWIVLAEPWVGGQHARPPQLAVDPSHAPLDEPDEARLIDRERGAVGTRTELQLPELAASATTDSEGPPTVASVAEGIVVRCIDAATGASLEHAPNGGLRLFRSTLAEVDGRQIRRHAQPVAATRDHGVEILPDAAGRFVVERPFVETWFAAVTDDRHGWSLVEMPMYDREVVVELRRQELLHVDVVGPNGEPVGGVHVSLSLTFWTESGARGSAGTGLSGVTGGDDGRVTIDVARLADSEYLPRATEVVAKAYVRMVEDAIATYSIGAPPIEPLVIRLPAFGRVVVEQELDGVVRPLGQRVELESVEGRAIRGVASAHAGRAVFEVVEVGHRFQVAVTLPGDGFGYHEFGEPFDGPREHGEEVVVRAGAIGEVVIARLVDEASEPLAEAEVRTLFSGGVSNGTTTDELGFAYFKVPHLEQVFDGDRFTVVFEDVDRRDGPLRRGEGSVVIPGGARRDASVRGVHDLGDVVMRVPPPLVSGIVVDSAGRAVPGVVVGARGTVAGRSRSIARAASGADGRFQLPESVRFDVRTDVGDLVLTAGSASVVMESPMTFEIGSEVTVTVVRRGRVEGRVAVDDLGRLFDARIVAKPSSGARQWGTVEALADQSSDRFGEFALTLPPGRWDLELWATVERSDDFRSRGFGTGTSGIQGYDVLIDTLEGLSVGPDAHLRPDALDPWLGLASTGTCAVRDANGEPVRSGVAMLIQDGRAVGRIPVRRGAFDLRGTLRPVDAWIEVDDHAAQFVSDVVGGSVVVLEPAPTLEVSFDLPASGLPDGHSIEATATLDVPFEGDTRRSAQPERDDYPTGPLRFAKLSWTGVWTIQLHVRDARRLRTPIGEPMAVDVSGGAEIQRARIVLHEGDLAAALAALEES
ncbi:hypothetical protein Pla163_06470 [Planctomycetes bacterium Pla163]|uniref:Nickel uptake substrate-specific transmembrane region n=1 Tax=Rohdeia mirabilis TaxID=2528008 RepID=A0A518CWH3_9BACT|nr:hypothetical protein Pla163_06470 [Planctomycetes bacterium Pla163]